MSKEGQIGGAAVQNGQQHGLLTAWHLSTAALQELDFLENEGLIVDSFIPIILLHTVAYALLKILNVCKAVAIFVRLDYIN